MSNVQTINFNNQRKAKEALIVSATEKVTGIKLDYHVIIERKTYSATEIGDKLGVSANKIGRLANTYNLKTPQFGKWFYDKAQHSNKEVETFRYYEKAISKFRTLLGGAVA